MQRIKVKFYFWQDYDTQNWSYTSLMGNDKEAVLHDFDFGVIFNNDRAILINDLWREFYKLYIMMKKSETDSTFFASQAKKWLDLFLTPFQGELNTISFKKGLYRPKDITPYIHVLINHVSEFIEKHKQFGLSAFSCAAVEKKNHEQVSTFFRKTMKDGGNGIERKSAIFEILYYENKSMYFFEKSTINSITKP
ncbi:hypothetical protein Glove_307g42 [Diversispora epigaea]|uniref:Uncharacterized protein n=1 Tax=Diversispora epigaea TaxID=1348612 RepID=A0A397HWS4_9GLOM|nr:hypothetical protein Glove_307g42 [Diversispora epigaea]